MDRYYFFCECDACCGGVVTSMDGSRFHRKVDEESAKFSEGY